LPLAAVWLVTGDDVDAAVELDKLPARTATIGKTIGAAGIGAGAFRTGDPSVENADTPTASISLITEP